MVTFYGRKPRAQHLARRRWPRTGSSTEPGPWAALGTPHGHSCRRAGPADHSLPLPPGLRPKQAQQCDHMALGSYLIGKRCLIITTEDCFSFYSTSFPKLTTALRTCRHSSRRAWAWEVSSPVSGNDAASYDRTKRQTPAATYGKGRCEQMCQAGK